MDKFADVLGRVGAWAGQNKYLSSIKNAFQSFMPLTIAGAVGVLWSNVIVNDSTGLGLFFKPIMSLSWINPAFSALNFACIGCITIGITFGVAQEICEHNGETGYFGGLLGISGLLSVTPWDYFITVDGVEHYALYGIGQSYLGATGLFTGLIVGVLIAELFCFLRKVDALKIKMPEMVPPGVARAFEVMVPAIISLFVVSLLGLLIKLGTGLYVNNLIQTYIQEPLSGVGTTLPGIFVMYFVIMAFWFVGIHGNNMVSAVKEALYTPLTLINTGIYESNGADAYDDKLSIVNMVFLQTFGEFGGSGVTLGLLIAIMIFGKREDNRTIAGISIVPGLFNINETVTFGIPMVLNTVLAIPFILAPFICICVGYALTAIGFCPKVVLSAPWTCPPILQGFIATGANVMGGVSQAIAIVVSVVVYTPFFIAYESYQNKQAAE